MFTEILRKLKIASLVSDKKYTIFSPGTIYVSTSLPAEAINWLQQDFRVDAQNLPEDIQGNLIDLLKAERWSLQKLDYHFEFLAKGQISGENAFNWLIIVNGDIDRSDFLGSCHTLLTQNGSPDSFAKVKIINLNLEMLKRKGLDSPDYIKKVFGHELFHSLGLEDAPYPMTCQDSIMSYSCPPFDRCLKRSSNETAVDCNRYLPQTPIRELDMAAVRAKAMERANAKDETLYWYKMFEPVYYRLSIGARGFASEFFSTFCRGYIKPCLIEAGIKPDVAFYIIESLSCINQMYWFSMRASVISAFVSLTLKGLESQFNLDKAKLENILGILSIGLGGVMNITNIAASGMGAVCGQTMAWQVIRCLPKIHTEPQPESDTDSAVRASTLRHRSTNS